MPTIRDIAKLAGVSVATVSRIINHSGKVSSNTKDKVEKIIKETNYQPNQVARTLYQKKSRMIGIIIPDLNNRFYAQIIDGIQKTIQPEGYTALISFSASSSELKYREAITNFEKNNVDGIISSAFSIAPNFQLKTPLVMYDSANIPDRIIRVASNNKKGGKESVDLLRKPIKKVLVQHWPLSLPTIRERVEAIIEELNNRKIPYFLEEASETNPHQAAQNALDKTNLFDAIITVNDLYAAEIIKESKKRNLNIPSEFQLVGYDNNILCEYTYPTLSTIDQQPQLIGQTAAKRLIQLIKGNTDTSNSLIDILAIKRESTK